MVNYILRRLLLLPLTLFCILVVNFIIINMAPGDPVTVTNVSAEGSATRKTDDAASFGSDERYLQFREHYGLTLPIIFNTWPWISESQVRNTLWTITNKKESPQASGEMPYSEYDRLRIAFGDKARFIMPQLLKEFENPAADAEEREAAIHFFIRGGTQQAVLGPNITAAERDYNKKISRDNSFLRSQKIHPADSSVVINEKVEALKKWYVANKETYVFEPQGAEFIKIFFTETRFFKYMSRAATLDFGTLRNDSNKTVISEVVKRFKYSLTLSLLPMMATFVLCQFFGFIMALKQHGWQDVTLSVIFLVLYAIPIFVVAPFLIEKVAVNGYFPFTDIPIPLSGFTSPEREYSQLLSYQRLFDVMRHIYLPLIAIIYGTLAVQSRLSRTAVLEVLKQDYVRTAEAKGVPKFTLLFKHVGRNAAITIVTALASSLGVILAGSLIVETLFEIDGFGKFYYDAIINRDYNVIMFSALAGAFLSLAGYLIADIAYTLLDPRISLD